MNFCRTFRDTVLKEIGKIYAVRGKKLVLSFPAPYTGVLFCVLFSRGFFATSPKEELARRLHSYKLSAQPQFLQVKLERW